MLIILGPKLSCVLKGLNAAQLHVPAQARHDRHSHSTEAVTEGEEAETDNYSSCGFRDSLVVSNAALLQACRLVPALL